MRRALWILVGALAFLTAGAQGAAAADPVVSASDVTVYEDATSGHAVVALRLDRAAPRRITVNWKTVKGTATTADFVADSGTAVFRVGDRVRNVTVALRDDLLDEATERFFVALDSTSARVPDPKAAVDIRDDDPLPRLAAATKTVTEGARGTETPAPVALTLSRASGRRVTVKWAVVNGSATAGVDVRGSNTAAFPPGTTRVVLPAEVIGDNVAEGPESAVVKLTAPVNATVNHHGAVTITDDDDPATATDLQLRLATTHAESHTFSTVLADDITLQGGTIEAIGTDGTVYRLIVPDGALPQPTTITVTPWADVEGVSAAGGRFAGVDLKPSGLEFLAAATLQVLPPEGADVQAISFAYLNNGRESHRYPMLLDTTKLEFAVSHFSGLGTYLGDNISIPVEPAPPTDPAQALAAEIQRLTSEERNRLLDDPTAEPNDEVMVQVVELMRSYYTHVVVPLLPGIREDCDFAKAKQAIVLGWAHQAAVLAETSFGVELAEVLDAVGDAAENCLNEAMQPCVDPDDIAQRNEINYWWRQVALQGRPEPDPRPNDPVRHCKEVLLGSLMVQYDRTWYTGTDDEFYHEEHYTTTFQPRLVSPSPGYWIDDGRGTWSMTGSESLDVLLDNHCGDYVDTFTGGGRFRTTMYDNETQLNPDDHLGLANFKIESFVPGFPYGTPTVGGDYVYAIQQAGYLSQDGECVPHNTERNGWKSVPGCGLESGPGVAGTRKTEGDKEGVEFNCTVTDDSGTRTITITGTFWLTQA